MIDSPRIDPKTHPQKHLAHKICQLEKRNICFFVKPFLLLGTHLFFLMEMIKHKNWNDSFDQWKILPLLSADCGKASDDFEYFTYCNLQNIIQIVGGLPKEIDCLC